MTSVCWISDALEPSSTSIAGQARTSTPKLRRVRSARWRRRDVVAASGEDSGVATNPSPTSAVTPGTIARRHADRARSTP
jgi:hypothetical protein